MDMTATILLIGLMSFGGGQVEQVRSRRAGGGSGRRPEDVRRILSEQAREWRIESREMSEQELRDMLKEVPDVAGVETRIWPHWQEVSSLLVKEMKRPGDVWQKIYLGRTLVALLGRASGEELTREERSLIMAFRYVPGTVRQLSAPRGQVGRADEEEFREAIKEARDEDDENEVAELVEERLRASERARRETQLSGAENEEIVSVNRGVEVLAGDFTRLLFRSGGPAAYRAVLAKLHRQLVDGDAAFEQTLAALAVVRLEELDPRQQKSLLSSFNALQRRHRGKRLYTVYTEVRRGRRGPEFGQRGIDFSASLRKLKERWERGEVSSEERKDEPVESKDGKEPEEEVGTEGDSADKVPGYGR